MRSVLCYGDSNTWGYATVPRPDGRYAHGERWTGILRSRLGSGWMVIEEGLGGRTTVSDDPVEGLERNGRTYLLPCLQTHAPLDFVTIMLGTVDLKARFNKSAWEIAAGVGALVGLVKSAAAGKSRGVPEILVVCPPPTQPDLKEFSNLFAGAHAKSLEIAPHYRLMAEQLGVHFLDAGSVVKSSVVDGFHLDPDAHQLLGEAIAAKIVGVMGRS